ncbi:MAG: class I SAM-dependent methyltransferase [Thermomicrobiales bacterium]
MDYYGFLNELHHLLLPQAYLEIGVWKGASLALASCCSVGVDPESIAEGNCWGAKPWLKLYRLTSDEFFARHSRNALFEDVPLELSFLDGMHHFECALRDFINTERWSAPDGCIVVHDVYPLAPDWAEREPRHLTWTGDVWKLVPCLRRYRPDLRVEIVDAVPSGMMVVRNLDPASTTLSDRLDQIVDEFLNDPRPHGEQFAEHLATIGAVPVDAWLRETRRLLGF